ncbi:ABC transporter substrate-binding protein [Consotaella aegiceratis]|uniref:ABC transporter substrate-binding protein n=1 Tax=Consotaella aegiceratis TaxID=3097961 RepID=UPI002F40FCB2
MKSMKVLAITALTMAALEGTAAAQSADVLHYWTSGSEAKALGAIARAYEEQGGEWVDSAVADFDTERSVAMNRFAGGNPPTAMLTELGQQVVQMSEAGLLRDISALAEDGDWKSVLPPAVVEAVTVDGKFTAIPVDIGGRNWMYYSPKVLSDAGVEVPTTWDEFLAAAEKIKAAGYIPLALGGQSWQEALLFSSVMAGVGGNDFFKKVYEEGDAEAARGPEMVKVFETYRKLGAYVDEGSPGRAWNDATNLVITDQAAAIVMGDWAKGEFANAGLEPGEGFGCVLAPGTQHFYDIIVDAFAFPKVSEDAQAAQDKLAKVMMDPAVQVDFNRIKGSLPPRLDADVSTLDSCAVKGQEVLAADDTYVPSINSQPNNDVAGQLEDIVSEFWNTPDMSAQDAAERYGDVLESAQ